MTKRKIDRLDVRILAVLSARGRETIIDIARQVGLSSTPCGTRVERLEQTGYILGYRTDIDLDLLAGYRTFCVTAALKTWTPKAAARLESQLLEIPNVVACDGVLGSLDYVILFCARSLEECHGLLEPLRALAVDFEIHSGTKSVVSWQMQRLLTEISAATDLP